MPTCCSYVSCQETEKHLHCNIVKRNEKKKKKRDPSLSK